MVFLLLFGSFATPFSPSIKVLQYSRYTYWIVRLAKIYLTYLDVVKVVKKLVLKGVFVGFGVEVKVQASVF